MVSASFVPLLLNTHRLTQKLLLFVHHVTQIHTAEKENSHALLLISASGPQIPEFAENLTTHLFMEVKATEVELTDINSSVLNLALAFSFSVVTKALLTRSTKQTTKCDLLSVSCLLLN